MSLEAVFFDGWGNNPQNRASIIQKYLQIPVSAVPYWGIHYTGKFEPTRILKQAQMLAERNEADQLLIIGASLGGRLAVDLAQMLHAAGRKVALLLLSPVASSSDVGMFSKLVRFAPYALVSQVMPLVSARWIQKFPEADRPRIAEYNATCDAIPWKIKQQQLQYLDSTVSPPEGSLAEIPTCGVWVKQDPLVRLTSLGKYRLATSGRIHALMFEGTGHNDFIESPDAWAERLAQVRLWLDRLG